MSAAAAAAAAAVAGAGLGASDTDRSKKRKRETTPAPGQDHRDQLKDARKIIQKMSQLLFKMGATEADVLYHMYQGGLCVKCYRSTGVCICKDSRLPWARELITFLNGGPVEDDTKMNGMIAAVMYAERHLMKGVLDVPAQYATKSRLEVAVTLVNIMSSRRGYVPFEQPLVWLLEMLSERTALSLNSAFATERQPKPALKSESESESESELELTARFSAKPVLLYACDREKWSMAFALLRCIPGDADAMERGFTALDRACEGNAPPFLLRRIIERSSEATLNRIGDDLRTPLFRLLHVVVNAPQHTVRFHARRALKVLVMAAHIDGSGLDLLTTKYEGLTPVEYAHRGETMSITQSVVNTLTPHIERIQAYRSNLVSSLSEALGSALPVNEIVMLVGAYVAPRFQELRQATVTPTTVNAASAPNSITLQPAQPERRAAAAAAAAAALDRDLAVDMSDVL